MTISTSEKLRQKIDQIMHLWEKRALKEVSAAQLQETLALRNSLPDYLQKLADELSTTIDRTDARNKADKMERARIGKKHGTERASSENYTLDQLIFEYHILRQVICDVLEEDAVLTPVEREVIVCSVEQAVNDAATQFTDTLRGIQEQLTYTLIHDLRSPITASKIGAQMILRKPDDASNCLNKAGKIIVNMDRLDHMIRDLLDASRVRSGQKLALEFNECDLDWIIRDVIDESNFVHEGRVRINSDGKCLGQWSENGLRRVTENLISNAIKYGSENEPIIVSLKQDDKTATVSVHNEGNEISADEKAILFQQFRRTRTSKNKSGWGIGLTVVKGMVDAHKGTIDVFSEKGKGTTFTFTIPKDPRA